MNWEFMKWEIEHPIEAMKLRYEEEIEFKNLVIERLQRELDKKDEQLARVKSML